MRIAILSVPLTVFELATAQDAVQYLTFGSSFVVPGAALLLVFISLIIPAFFLLMWVVGGYNRLVALQNAYKRAYEPVDAALKHRYDLIPELVETAKAYLQNDRGTLESVSAARNAASAANVRAAHLPGDVAVMGDLCGAETALAGTLARFFSAAADNSELKANPRMISLTRELTSAAAKAASAGQSYNDAVMRYNALRNTFPTNFIAGPFSFGAAELLVFNGMVTNPV